MNKHLLLVGAGHAHLETIINVKRFLEKGIRVTVLSPSPYQYYSGMGPGLLQGFYPAEAVRFDMKNMAESRGAVFLEGTAARVEPEKRLVHLASGDEIAYDAVSFSIGSEIDTGPIEILGDNIYTVKPIESLSSARQAINNALLERNVEVVVVGGGAAGVEIAANASQIGREAPFRARISLITRGKLLRRFPAAVRRKASRKLLNLGVSVLEDTAIEGSAAKNIVTSQKKNIPYNFMLVASGTRPPSLFSGSNLPTGETGGLLVNRFLQSTGFPDIFGGGDCIDFAPMPLAKVGVYAVRENEVLLENLLSILTGGALKVFSPQRHYHLSLNMGDGTGISYRPPVVLSGLVSFKIKDKIDRKFMKKYQEPEVSS
ncbi:MAG: FAD-dependent oxidoreductase [Spirochaetales bacterium]|nr:FAD-dependent oxidoreductase [Spirochaetales bacterium]